MAAPATAIEFLDLVKKSGVADDKRLEAHVARLRQGSLLPNEPSKVAGVLVRDGFLTQFQAEQILQGKWRRFTIGKYKVLERLGSGGMGQVYLCEHKMMRRRVAIKVLPAAKAQDSSALERFYREARAVAALDHPNIVHAYDIDQDETLHFLVMEYVDGSNLQEIIKKTGPMSVLRACHYVRQAALGLEHAHLAGLVHRDIKPGNVLVDRTGIVKILDMGLARFFHDEEDILTKKYDETVLGTADYLAPEQALDSHSVDIRADIYSLGATFYYLLSAKTPFGEGTVAQKLMWHQTRNPKPIHELRPEVPPGVVAVINKMMAKDPKQRYQTPGELAEALDPFTQTPIGPPPEEEMPRLSPAALGAAPVDSTPETAVRGATAPVRPGSGRVSTTGSNPGTHPSGLRVPPLAQPVQPAAAVAERAPWGELEEETQDAAAHADTPPQSKRRRNPTEEVFTQTKRRVWLVVAICAVPIVLAVGVLAVIFVANRTPSGKTNPTPPPTDPAKRTKLVVKSGAKRTDSVFPTIRDALRDARRGETIELHDDVIAENLFVDGFRLPPNVTLEAAPGKKVTWKSAHPNLEEPIVHIVGAADFVLNGRGITFDGATGKGAVRDLLVVQMRCPGLVIKDAEFTTFERSAIAFVNAQGSAATPIRLDGVWFFGKAKAKTGGAVILDADDEVRTVPFNDHIVFEASCHFVDLPAAKAIVPLHSGAVGRTVQILAK